MATAVCDSAVAHYTARPLLALCRFVLMPGEGRFVHWPISALMLAQETRSMSRRQNKDHARLDRRAFLRRFAGAATLAAAGVAAAKAAAEDRSLDALMGETDRGEFGQTFDQASRTIHMPKASAPTLSPVTAETTAHAVETYETIVDRGGWPE